MTSSRRFQRRSICAPGGRGDQPLDKITEKLEVLPVFKMLLEQGDTEGQAWPTEILLVAVSEKVLHRPELLGKMVE